MKIALVFMMKSPKGRSTFPCVMMVRNVIQNLSIEIDEKQRNEALRCHRTKYIGINMTKWLILKKIQRNVKFCTMTERKRTNPLLYILEKKENIKME
jgi:hypothetical protein